MPPLPCRSVKSRPPVPRDLCKHPGWQVSHAHFAPSEAHTMRLTTVPRRDCSDRKANLEPAGPSSLPTTPDRSAAILVLLELEASTCYVYSTDSVANPLPSVAGSCPRRRRLWRGQGLYRSVQSLHRRQGVSAHSVPLPPSSPSAPGPCRSAVLRPPCRPISCTVICSLIRSLYHHLSVWYTSSMAAQHRASECQQPSGCPGILPCRRGAHPSCLVG